MKGLTLRQKLRWFVDYYLWKVILITAGAVLGLYLLKLAMFPGIQPEAEILVITPVKGDYSKVEAALSEKMDLPDTDGAVKVGYMEENTAFSGTVLGMKLSSGEFDAVIAEREHFHFLENSGLLEDLAVVSDSVLTDVPRERLIFCEGQKDTEASSAEEEVKPEASSAEEEVKPEASSAEEKIIPGAVQPESYISGIRLAGNEFYSACTKYMDDPVLGIIRSQDDMEEERIILECAF